jgi:hypothetical protein
MLSTNSKAASLLGKSNSLEVSDVFTGAEVDTLILMLTASTSASFRKTIRRALNRYAQHLDIGADANVFLE